MTKILIKNIKELIQVESVPKARVLGSEMNNLPTLKDAWLAIENGIIVDFGSMEIMSGITDWSNLQIIDASEKMVFPSWCDSHTHLIFAASRESEFVDRINGLTYENIAAKGGGILNSAKKLENASEEELYQSALKRIKEIEQLGTGAVEIKSGYGLSVAAEIKMLRVAKRLKETANLTIKTTFLGAHALPQQYKQNRQAYIDLIINKMLPIIKKEQLAEYIDVFCETNYFTPEETNIILKAGTKSGLKPKIHVNQFTTIGGVQVGIENSAVSVDHLEIMSKQDLKDIAQSTTIPTVLPSCSFFLGIPYAPSKKMIKQNLPLALASDYNPGSTPSGNMNFVVSLACIKMKLTPEQAINAATINGAAAMELTNQLGSIAIGKKANLFITKEISSYAFLPYSFGQNIIETIILNGKIIIKD